MARIPYQIFDKTYEAAPYLFPDYIRACEWREIRIYAEKFARKKKGQKEISLDDIYEEIPHIIENQKKIMEMEIAVEGKNTYLNPQMAELLYELKQVYQKKICLISDMYLSKTAIIRILETNHMDLSLIDHIYISSEYGRKKSSGELYEAVCKELGCEPEHILHIGDSWKADYLSAKKMGLQAIHYPVISEGKYRYPYLDYEYVYGAEAGRDIYSIRLLAAESNLTGEEKEWFEMGAMILGPLLTFASDWVLDQAEKNNISHIYPMMREGYFLAKLLKRAAEYRNWSGTIKPLYISRRALYPALLSVLKMKDIHYLFTTRKMTVGTVLRILEIKSPHSQLSKYKTLTLSEAKKVFIQEKSVYRILEDTLFNQDVVDELKREHEDADELLWEYLKSFKMDCEDFITFDVGWRGNAQNAIERIRAKHKADARGIHLLVTGKKEVLKERNLEDSTDIRGFGANFGENFQTVSNIMIPIFEMLMMCREGTTKGYEKTTEGVKPICKENPYSEYQLKMMEAVQAGVINFQNILYTVYDKKGEQIVQNGGALLKIVSRLMAAPLKREAELIGKMQYDQNFGMDKKWRIISPEHLESYKVMGYNQFVHQKKAREDEWYQGMDVHIDELVFYKRIMFHRRNEVWYQYALYAERICHECNSFVLVGAGKRLRWILLYLHLMNKESKIAFVADNDENLQKEKILGYPVRALETESECDCYVLTTGKRKLIFEMTRQLYEIKGKGIEIINFFD